MMKAFWRWVARKVREADSDRWVVFDWNADQWKTVCLNNVEWIDVGKE